MVCSSSKCSTMHCKHFSPNSTLQTGLFPTKKSHPLIFWRLLSSPAFHPPAAASGTLISLCGFLTRVSQNHNLLPHVALPQGHCWAQLFSRPKQLRKRAQAAPSPPSSSCGPLRCGWGQLMALPGAGDCRVRHAEAVRAQYSGGWALL